MNTVTSQQDAWGVLSGAPALSTSDGNSGSLQRTDSFGSAHLKDGTGSFGSQAAPLSFFVFFAVVVAYIVLLPRYLLKMHESTWT